MQRGRAPYQPSSRGLSFNSTFSGPMRDRSDSIALLKRVRGYPEGMTGSSIFEERGTISLVDSSTTWRFSAVALSRRRSGMPEYLSDSFGGGWKDDMVVCIFLQVAGRVLGRDRLISSEETERECRRMYLYDQK